MKKKIMAVLATIAAVLGNFGFATNTAMADDYGATVTYRRHHRYRDVPCRHIPAERIRHRVLR